MKYHKFKIKQQMLKINLDKLKIKKMKKMMNLKTKKSKN